MAANGLCASGQHDPELWFPLSDKATAQVALAKSICNACPIQDACLERALTRGYDHGIWGGMTEEERRTIKRRMGGRASAYVEELAATLEAVA